MPPSTPPTPPSVSVVAGSHISTPPLGPILVVMAIGVGHWLIHGRWLELPGREATWQGWMQFAGRLMIEWSLGSLLVGSVLAAAAFVVLILILLVKPYGLFGTRNIERV